MAIKNVVTLGIGAAPGNIKFFVLLGLGTSVVTTIVDLTLRDRTVALTLKPRTADLTLRDRTTALTLENR